MNQPHELNPYQTPSDQAQASPFMPSYGAQRSYGGIRRLPYFGYTFLAGVIYQVLVAAVVSAISSAGADPAILMAVIGVIFVAYMCVIFFIASKRLVNIGSNPWWCLGLIVPLLNIFVGVRCLICPEGYADHKTLDTAAKVMLGLAIACIILTVFAIVIAVNS